MSAAADHDALFTSYPKTKETAMSAALATTNHAGMAFRSELQDFRFTADQRKLILDTCCGGASPSEAAVLIGIAEMRGLNPITQECYFVQRWDSNKGRMVWAVQVSIDAMRIKAEESGVYAGQDEPEYEYEPGSKVPSLARIKIYRKDWERPCVGVARYSEYVQRKKDGSVTKFWKDMPHNQLAKCAEAIGLRKAFPARLAKLYTNDEMAQASNEGPGAPAAHDEETGEVIETPSDEGRAQAEAVAGKLSQAILAAGDIDALKKVWVSAMGAQKGGFITLTQRAVLCDAKDARKRELAAADAAKAKAAYDANKLPESWGGEPPPGALESDREPGQEG